MLMKRKLLAAAILYGLVAWALPAIISAGLDAPYLPFVLFWHTTAVAVAGTFILGAWCLSEIFASDDDKNLD